MNHPLQTEASRLPREMRYPKYLVLITCTLLIVGYFLIHRANLLATIKFTTFLEKNKTVTLLESELTKNYNINDLSQIKKPYIVQNITLADLTQGDVLEITFDYDTLAKGSKNSKKLMTSISMTNIPIGLVTLFQGNQDITQYYLKNQLRSKIKFKLPLDINLDKYIRLEVKLTGIAPLNLYSLSFTQE